MRQVCICCVHCQVTSNKVKGCDSYNNGGVCVRLLCSDWGIYPDKNMGFRRGNYMKWLLSATEPCLSAIELPYIYIYCTPLIKFVCCGCSFPFLFVCFSHLVFVVLCDFVSLLLHLVSKCIFSCQLFEVKKDSHTPTPSRETNCVSVVSSPWYHISPCTRDTNPAV